MIIVLKQGTAQREIDSLTARITAMGDITVTSIIGTDLTILGLVGDTTRVDENQIESQHCVERIMHVAEPFKKANRMFHPVNTTVRVGGSVIGGEALTVIAGPCSVESEEQIVGIATAVKAAGARNMQNFDLLRQLGRIDKPILLKRGLSATIEEWLMSAEYILSEGNPNVILCERGIRTFETYTRNTVDLGAIPAVKRLSHLPVLVDPSHGTGKAWMVEPMARAAIAIGADGIMVEVHNDPAHALCDGQQSIKPEVFSEVMKDIRAIAGVIGRTV